MESAERDSAAESGDGRLVEAFLTAFVSGDAEAIADLVTEDCVLHQPRWPLDTEGRAAIVETTGGTEGSFTDVEIVVERTLASGDELAA